MRALTTGRLRAPGSAAHVPVWAPATPHTAALQGFQLFSLCSCTAGVWTLEPPAAQRISGCRKTRLVPLSPVWRAGEFPGVPVTRARVRTRAHDGYSGILSKTGHCSVSLPVCDVGFIEDVFNVRAVEGSTGQKRSREFSAPVISTNTLKLLTVAAMCFNHLMCVYLVGCLF